MQMVGRHVINVGWVGMWMDGWVGEWIEGKKERKEALLITVVLGPTLKEVLQSTSFTLAGRRIRMNHMALKSSTQKGYMSFLLTLHQNTNHMSTPNFKEYGELSYLMPRRKRTRICEQL